MKKVWGVYFVALFSAFVFSQTLFDKFSYVVFLAVLLLPVVCLIYSLIVLRFISHSVFLSKTVVEKGEEMSVSIIVSNETFLPFPFLKLVSTLPNEAGTELVTATSAFYLMPKDSFCIDSKIAFKYRGLYKIGIDSLLVYDFFKLFSFKVKIKKSYEITVLPRKLRVNLTSGQTNSEDDNTAAFNKSGLDHSEINDLREYIPGDSLKSIHWKLSTKLDDLVVRIFNQSGKSNNYIIADLKAYSGDKEQNEIAADGVVETAIALSMRSFLSNQSNHMVWYDRNYAGVFTKEISSLESFYDMFRSFAVAEAVPEAYGAAAVINMLDDFNAEQNSLFVVTANINSELIAVLSMLSAINRRNVFLFYYNTGAEDSKHLMKQLAENGVNAVDIKHDQIVRSINEFVRKNAHIL